MLLLGNGFERVKLFCLFGRADDAQLAPLPAELVALVLGGVRADVGEGGRAVVNPAILRGDVHVWSVTVPFADEAAPRRLKEQHVGGLRRADNAMPMRRSLLRQFNTPNEHEAIIERSRFNLFPHRYNETLPVLADCIDRIGNRSVSVSLNGEGDAVQRDALPFIWEIQQFALEVAGRGRREGDYAAVLPRLVTEASPRIIGGPIRVDAPNVKSVVMHCHYAVVKGYRSHNVPFIKTKTV